MRLKRFWTGVTITGAILGGVVMSPGATASAAEMARPVETNGPDSVDAQFECGFLRCSFVFTRSQTRTISASALPGAACGFIPFPGSVACGVSYAIANQVAKLAVSENACLKITYATVAPYPSWYSSDGGSRCK